VERTRERALRGLGELKTGLLRVVGRLDTVGKAAGYVLEKRVRVRVRVKK